MTQEHAESHIKLMQRFKNFWSNVSKLSVADSVKPDAQDALVRGMDKAYGPEAGRTE